VSRLGLSTIEEKVAIIRNLDYPINLVDLEYSLAFFSYYRKFILNYTRITEPLEVLKTLGFWAVLKKTIKKRRRTIVEKELFYINDKYKAV
jgi:hypothetical protein